MKKKGRKLQNKIVDKASIIAKKYNVQIGDIIKIACSNWYGVEVINISATTNSMELKGILALLKSYKTWGNFMCASVEYKRLQGQSVAMGPDIATDFDVDFKGVSDVTAIETLTEKLNRLTSSQRAVVAKIILEFNSCNEN